MIFASLLIVTIFHVMLFSKRGLLDPISILFLAFIYYSYVTPIVILTFDDVSVDFAGSQTWVRKEIIDESAILFAVGYVGFCLSYFLCTAQRDVQIPIEYNQRYPELFYDTYFRFLLILSIVTFIVFSILFRDELTTITESYEGKISENYENSIFGFLYSFCLTLLSLLANYYILNSKKYVRDSALIIVGFVFLSLLVFSKAPLIYATLCAFCALHRLQRVPYPVLLIGLMIGAGLISVLFLPLFSVYRASGEIQFVTLDAQTIRFMIAEASSPFTIVHSALSGYVRIEGHPLWQSFVLWIPRGLWESRPLDIAESFAQQVIVNWQSGFGLGFSPFAEAYARVGILGSFLFMGMSGAVMAILQRNFAGLMPPIMRIPATLTIGGIISVLFLRGAFSGLITQSIQNWVPVVLISLLASEVARRRVKSQNGAKAIHR